MAAVEPAVKRYVFFHLSDQWPSPDAYVEAMEKELIRHETNALQAITSKAESSLPIPDKLTIGRMPFDSYRRRVWGHYSDGKRIISIDFFDPEHFPKYETLFVLGGFPHYFSLSVDWNSKKVIKHYAEEE